MTYFEGIGDEVLITVAVVMVVLASLVFWSLTETSTPSPANSTHTTSQSPILEQRTTPRRDSVPSTSPPERLTGEAEAESRNHPPTEETSTEDSLTVHDHIENHNSGSDCNDNENVDVRQLRLDFFNKNSTEGTQGVNYVETVVNGPLVNSVVDSQSGTGEGATSDLEIVHIRLKYLDDTERVVQTQLSQNIREFKRIHFADELSNNRLVRLISTGYVLEDSRTLESYGLMDNSVIHVQIQTNQVNSRRISQEAESELDIGQFLSPILGVTLLCVWIMHFQYKEYFSTTSTVALLVLSVLFLTVVWGQHSASRTLNTPVQ